MTPHDYTFSSLQFFFYQIQLPACLSANRSIFLCPPHQIRHYILNGSKRQVLAYAAAGFCQVVSNVIAHAIQLTKMYMRMSQCIPTFP